MSIILVGSEAGIPRLQYRIGDHLNNTVVLFEDKNDDGILHDPEDILVKKLYYPFGMELQGVIPDTTSPMARYLYNNKEFEKEGGVYFYGARLYAPVIGRFAGVDPIAEKFPHVSVYNYAENRPIDGIDLWGLQWVHFQTGHGHQINVNVNISYEGETLSKEEYQSYLKAIDGQFRKTLESSSVGSYTGSVTFGPSTNPNQVTPSVSVMEEVNKSGVAGLSGLGTFALSIFDKNGNLLSPEDFALSFVHELFHTARLGHPFEITQSSDTELVHVAGNDYATTENTSSTIFRNIMNYSIISINGSKLGDIWKQSSGDLLTMGQLNFLLQEINGQQEGAGTPNDPNYLYWVDYPGTPVKKN